MQIETYRSFWINGILMDWMVIEWDLVGFNGILMDWMRFEEGLVGLGIFQKGYHDDIMG